MLVMLDWIKRGIFGRDLSKVSLPVDVWVRGASAGIELIGSFNVSDNVS
jgi:hypothetical protein